MAILSPKAIYEEISKNVVGQEEAKRTVSNAIFLHFIRYCQYMKDGDVKKKENVLLMGPTGSGKTYIVREACKALQKITGYPQMCPLLEVDCTELTGRGWEGDSISDVIKQHCVTCMAEDLQGSSSVIFLDEFDKLCKPAVGRGGQDHNRLTQYNLLKVVEGQTLKSDPRIGGGQMFKTHNMLFIFAGNFSEIRHKRKEKVMGFRKDSSDEKYVDYHTELDEMGMATQLVGRTPYIAELYELQEDELLTILNKHLLPDLESTWQFVDEELKLSSKAKKEIVSNCFKRKTGARGLQADLAKHLEDQIFNMEIKI